MTLTEIQNRIRTKREEIAATPYSEMKQETYMVAADIITRLSPTPTEDVPTPTELVDGYVRVPRNPSDAWFADVAMSYRHDFGLLHEDTRQQVLFRIKEIHHAMTKAKP